MSAGEAKQPNSSKSGRALVPARRRGRRPLTNYSALPAPRADRDPDDLDFLIAAAEIIEKPPSVAKTTLAYVICGVIAAAVIWSIFAILPVIAVAPGKVQAIGDTKVIQSLESGQVSAIPVHDGAHVKAGDIVLELNPAEALATRTAIADNLLSLRAEMTRRRAEAAAVRADPVDANPTIAWENDITDKLRERESGVAHAELAQLAASIADLQAQRKVKQVTIESLQASINSQTSLIGVNSQEVGMHETLATKGWDSREKVLEALQPLKQQEVQLSSMRGDVAEASAAIPVIDSQIAQLRENFIANNERQLASDDSQKDQLEQNLAKADWTLAHLNLRAPIDGVVHAMSVTTIGQAVSAGDQAMQIVPADAQLEVVAYVLNSDIGFVREGQKATIKIDSFPYTRYGTLPGTVTQVAADAVSGLDALHLQTNSSAPTTGGLTSGTSAAQQTTDLVFPVTVTLQKSAIDIAGKEMPLASGMSVVVEITTGKRRAITYVLYPLVRSFRSKPAQ